MKLTSDERSIANIRINHETSKKEDPIKSHLIKTLEIIWLRHMEKINILGIDPTPIATPAKEIKGILLAKYLKPRRIMNNINSKTIHIYF